MACHFRGGNGVSEGLLEDRGVGWIVSSPGSLGSGRKEAGSMMYLTENWGSRRELWS